LLGFDKHLAKLQEAVARVQEFDSSDLGLEIGHKTTVVDQVATVRLPGASFEIVTAIFQQPHNDWRFGQLTYRALVEGPDRRTNHTPFLSFFVDKHGNVGLTPDLGGFSVVGDWDWHIHALKHIPRLRLERARRLQGLDGEPGGE